MVWLAENLLHFYRHESCGKCTPCREGTDWLLQDPPAASSAAKGRCAISICSRASRANIAGKTLCAFGDAAVTPVLTTLKHFRHEYEAHIKEGRCTLPADWRARAAGAELTDIDDDHEARAADKITNLLMIVRDLRVFASS